MFESHLRYEIKAWGDSHATQILRELVIKKAKTNLNGPQPGQDELSKSWLSS